MNSRRGAATGAALLIVAVVLFAVLHKSGSSSNVTTGLTKIEFQDGAPVGGVHDIIVNKGDRVQAEVSSDHDANVDVHGYDFTKPVKAGGTVSYDFPATIDGEFEMEVHPVVNGEEQDGVQIVALTVNP